MPKHSVTLTATPKDPPDLDQFVAALLAMAVQRLAEQAEARDEASTPPEERRE